MDKSPPATPPAKGADRPFGVLCAFLLVVFATGGGSRGDIVSLLLLRPLSVLALAYGLSGLRFQQLQDNRDALLFMGLSIGLVVVHLVPLPPQIWQGLPGRDIVVSIDRAAGLEGHWRPLSLDPLGTRNALGALMVPAAVMVLAIRINRKQHERLLSLLIAAVAISALVAILQGMSDPNGPTYFYRVTNNGALVGLFANRNHQALLLAMAFPMLAARLRLVSATQMKEGALRPFAGVIVAVAFAWLLVPLILITGSRSGIFLGVLAIASTWLLRTRKQAQLRKHSSDKLSTLLRSRWILAGFGLSLIALAGLAVYLDRDLALARLLQRDNSDEMRLLILPVMYAMIRLYGLLGSGLGSFEAVYKIHEPDRLLGPTYMNHAHNDWLELVMTGGVPALMIVALLALALLTRIIGMARSKDLDSRRVLFTRLGLILIALAALASISDYPLRVPSLEAIFAISLVWALARRGDAEQA